MSTNSPTSLVRGGIDILRTDGVVATVRAGLRVLDLNYQGYYYYARHRYRTNLRNRIDPTDPFTVLSIDPKRIRSVPQNLWYRWDYLGEARPGDWDLTDRTVDDLLKYRSVVDHFENDTPWPETDVYREAIERIDRGETFWNGCRTREDVAERTRHVERLYERIRENGYRSQADIHGRPLRSIVLDRKFDRSKEEIAVAIGRGGEILFIDGNHRLAIAHVLDLDAIPVHVVTRHAEWQAIRDQVREASSIVDLSDRAREHVRHPDLADVRGSLDVTSIE